MRHETAGEMRVGPSEPAGRSMLQTTLTSVLYFPALYFRLDSKMRANNSSPGILIEGAGNRDTFYISAERKARGLPPVRLHESKFRNHTFSSEGP
jgi:hypothetical protein